MSIDRFDLLFADTARHDPIFSRETVDFLPIFRQNSRDTVPLRRILLAETTGPDRALRKEVFHDLRTYPSLRAKIEDAARRWGEFTEPPTVTEPTASRTDAIDALKRDAVDLMERLTLLQRTAESFAAETPGSRGIFGLQQWLNRIVDSPEIRRLSEEIRSYPLVPTDVARTVLHFRTDPSGAKIATELAYFGTDPDFYFKKNPTPKDAFTLLVPPNESDADTIEAIDRCSERFRNLSASIDDAMRPLTDAASFYRFGLSLFDRAETGEFRAVFPQDADRPGPIGDGIVLLSDHGDTTTFDLSDDPLRTDIDPNAHLLQVVAQTQLFALAGLPIPTEGDAVLFCPSERPTVFLSDGTDPNADARFAANFFRSAKKGDLLLLYRPCFATDATKPSVRELLHAFLSKGVRIYLICDIAPQEAIE